MHLSIALAVHNEENNITRCLDSVYDWADEIVIVDSGSTDRTVELIKKRDTSNKIRVFDEPHVAMFHINKQKALEQCHGEWILQLDADEVVSLELKEEIRSVILSNSEGSLANASLTSVRDSSASPQNDNVVAYWMPRLNYFLGMPLRKGGQYPDYTIRLYRNGAARFPCKSVHEQVQIITNNQLPITNQVPNSNSRKNENSLKIVNSKIDHLKAPLLHYPYPTFDAYLKKWARYALLEADMLYANGLRPSPVNFLRYMILYPKWWFFWTYIRHRGYTDGFAGFAFALFSALRYCVTYIKLYELTAKK